MDWLLKLPLFRKVMAGIILVIFIIEVICYGYQYKEGPWREGKQGNLARYTSTRRAELLKEMCGPRKYRKEIVASDETASYFVDKKRGFMLCALPKAGTTSWATFLLRLASGSENLNDDRPHSTRVLGKHGIIAIKSGRLQREYFDLYKLLQVRHPFARLISAYNDKVFGRRKQSRLCGALEIGVYPTWVQFAELVANRNSSCMDKHWMPYTEISPVCDMEFDAVTKIETISADIDDFFKRFNVNDKFHFDQEHVSAGGPSKTEDYMNALPEDVLSKLKKMFQTDMELFGANSVKRLIRFCEVQVLRKCECKC
ncbi:hypothetical protein CAPTEDRAFT_218558 [Capitella teleta]|uniref:Carbohydrate sulfotransferase n=1 Tax=Capitella teleta TaxID=283909 RepID=R7VG44_CAPTE|nr:hypothetical protein CAPTEDRAFT_218558 [Capitella teleta]|eukprot:ELU14650.1 hypothetical protein CAPTEDRAFT_218558 [Capitella teleta]